MNKNIIVACCILCIHPQLFADVSIDRYTTVQNIETYAQKNPLEAEVEIKFPKHIITVRDAINHLLLRSGYRLDTNFESSIIDGYVLPEVHKNIGPIKLKRAIEILLGNAWNIQVNELNRSIHIIKNGDNPFHITDTNSLIAEATQKDILDEIVIVDFIEGKPLQEALSGDKNSSGILPQGWKVTFTTNNRHKNIIIKVVSENKTRKEIISQILSNENMIGYFYPKLQLLVVRDNTKVIK